MIAYASDDQLGLISHDGITFAPSIFRTWRVVPNTGSNIAAGHMQVQQEAPV
ncbi:hypothetical protein [Nocardia sp. NPDC055049]